MSRCRSCGAPVLWASSERGRPVILEPDPEGAIVLRERDQGVPLAIHGVPADAYPGEPRYRSHFATCPDADRWRRREGAP